MKTRDVAEVHNYLNLPTPLVFNEVGKHGNISSSLKTSLISYPDPTVLDPYDLGEKIIELF